MKKEQFKLTKSELLIMQTLWEIGACTVRAIHEEITKTKKIGYTSTLKTMQLMYQKGLLKKDTSTVAHIYEPNIERTQVQGSLLNDFLKRTYSGNASNMILQALGNEKISDQELQAIDDFLKKMKDKRN